MIDPLALADWRRRVATLYAEVRERSLSDARAARDGLQARRDELFKTHPCTPLDEAARQAFSGLPYYPYRPDWRVAGRVDHHVARETTPVGVGQDGVLSLVRAGRVDFVCPAGDGTLDLFWVAGYGGGLFLPFGDATNGDTTYGGGRYLYDTIKGADLGASGSELILDFNFAYNPSCA